MIGARSVNRPWRDARAGTVRAALQSTLVAAGTTIAVSGLLALWIWHLNVGSLRAALVRWQFSVLEAEFVMCVALGAACLPAFVRSLPLSRSSVLTAVAASCGVVLLLAGAVPRTNRIYFDEQIYQGIAQNLSDLRLAQMCNDGTVEYGYLQCRLGEYNKQPYGYPYLVSLGYRAFGTHERVAHIVNMVCGVLLVWVVLLATTALFGDARAGALASVVAALIPQQLIWAATAASEPSAALMTIVALVSAIAFVRLRTWPALLWMVTAAAFAAQFRMESLLVWPLMLLVVALHASDAMRTSRFYWALLFSAILLAPHLAHFAVVHTEAWGAPAERVSLDFLWPNVAVNGRFFFDNARFPVVFTVLALVGLTSGPWRATVVAGAAFVLFWGVFLFFYAGSYQYGADVRFSLMSYPAVAILAGRGASVIEAIASTAGAAVRPVRVITVGALCFTILSYMPQIRAVGEEAWAARGDVEFARRVANDLPPNAVVLTHNPSTFLIRGMNAAQLSLATTDPAYVSLALPSRYAGGIFLHWNYWCNVDTGIQREFCDVAREQFHGSLVRQRKDRNYVYALYHWNQRRSRYRTPPCDCSFHLSEEPGHVMCVGASVIQEGMRRYGGTGSSSVRILPETRPVDATRSAADVDRLCNRITFAGDAAAR